MNNPKISIITVCYNAANVIEITIVSVLNQTYKNVEYIIVDGGSSDGTLDIIKKYDKSLSKWVSESDNGVYDAMNKGIDMATGKWVYFIGAGDILLNILDKLVFKLTNPNSIYYGNVYRNDLKKIYDGKYNAYKLAVTNICHQAIFYPLDVFKKYKYNTKYKLLADHDLNMRCYGDENFIFKYLPILISIYDGGGISAHQPDIDFFEDKINIIRDNFTFKVFLYATFRRKIARFIKTASAFYLKKSMV